MILWETLELERQTFAENDPWPWLFILLLGDAALPEWRQWSHDGAADPDRVGSVWLSKDLQRVPRGCECCPFSRYTLKRSDLVFWNQKQKQSKVLVDCESKQIMDRFWVINSVTLGKFEENVCYSKTYYSYKLYAKPFHLLIKNMEHIFE